MAKLPPIAWSYDLLMEALDQFKIAFPELPERRGFLGWSISCGEIPMIKLSISELGGAAFVSQVKLPKEFEAIVGGRKSRLRIHMEIVPLLPSVAPKSGQKKSPPQTIR